MSETLRQLSRQLQECEISFEEFEALVINHFIACLPEKLPVDNMALMAGNTQASDNAAYNQAIYMTLANFKRGEQL